MTPLTPVPYWYRDFVRQLPELPNTQLIVLLDELVTELRVRDYYTYNGGGETKGKRPKGPRPWTRSPAFKDSTS